MDNEFVALISTAATTLVGLMATDGWERAKSNIGALWRRAYPGHAEAVEAELADTRSAVLAARSAGDEQAERDLESEWRGRLRYLVAADPTLIGELSQLVQTLQAALSATGEAPGGHVEMHARASGHGRVYQAGHDLRIADS